MSQYFENDNKIKSERKIIKINIFNLNLELYTDNGVFSKDRLDYGTRLLLENIDIEKDNSNLLDLGCGYGPVGIILKNKYKNIEIDMADINKRAIKLTKENLKKTNTECNIIESNVYENIENKYDYIITNPPIRAGKETIKKFLIDSKYHLKENGKLWFVMRKDHGVKTIIKEMEKNFKVEVVTKDKGFYVVKATPIE